jgi:Subtilase family
MTTPHEVDPSFDPTSMTAVAQAVLEHPRVIHQADATCGALVLAFRDELLVRRVPGDHGDYGPLRQLLDQVAVQSGALTGAPGARGGLPADYDVEIWRLKNPHAPHGDAISEARRLLAEVPGLIDQNVPKVSPNHISVVCAYDMCPGGPPRRRGARKKPTVPKLRPLVRGQKRRADRVSVVVIDSGYISGHPALDGRGGITSEPGQWFDSAPSPGCWRDCPPDDYITYLEKGLPRLPGVAGHGTFIAGIVARTCADAEITVVGHRHECLPVEWTDEVDKLRLFTAEIAIAGSLLKHRNADVISCGFAFPTLDGLESIAFDIVMPQVSADTAVVAPAGNEDSACPHWPAAHRDVIGVAATKPAGKKKAEFSNWGAWLRYCSIGQNVLSTFGEVEAFPQDHKPDPGDELWRYDGWALWDGTSFAAPRVAARIACAAARDRTNTPRGLALGLPGKAGVPPVMHNTVPLPLVM